MSQAICKPTVPIMRRSSKTPSLARRTTWDFLQALQCQMPTALRFMAYFPQKLQKYLLCWLTSIFLICFRRDAPYRVPYFPTMPTFFVRFDISASEAHSNKPATGTKKPSKLLKAILVWAAGLTCIKPRPLETHRHNQSDPPLTGTPSIPPPSARDETHKKVPSAWGNGSLSCTPPKMGRTIRSEGVCCPSPCLPLASCYPSCSNQSIITCQCCNVPFITCNRTDLADAKLPSAFEPLSRVNEPAQITTAHDTRRLSFKNHATRSYFQEHMSSLQWQIDSSQTCVALT